MILRAQPAKLKARNIKVKYLPAFTTFLGKAILKMFVFHNPYDPSKIMPTQVFLAFYFFFDFDQENY
jgi:hypothetical protein